MLDAAAAGTLRALWVVGWDVAMTQPNMHATASALDRLEFLVVQDLFMVETARAHADVFLPACSAFEKDGTFMNGERRVQRVRPAVSPRGAARPDWDIVCSVARALGHGARFSYTDVEEIWDEVRAVWPAGAGMSYDRLEQPGGLQWPCPDEHHPGTTMLHEHRFAGGVTAALQPVGYRASGERVDDDFPYILMTGRVLEQFNAGSMTGRSVTGKLHETDVLEMSPADARRLGVDTGRAVRVTSRYGDAMLPVVVTARVADGQVFATFNDPSRAVNRLTGTGRDPVTNTPEYKVTAVRLAAAEG
jgi:formate dehydrogenase major subunit